MPHLTKMITVALWLVAGLIAALVVVLQLKIERDLDAVHAKLIKIEQRLDQAGKNRR
jgi:hypothetical protein